MTDGSAKRKADWDPSPRPEKVGAFPDTECIVEGADHEIVLLSEEKRHVFRVNSGVMNLFPCFREENKDFDVVAFRQVLRILHHQIDDTLSTSPLEQLKEMARIFSYWRIDTALMRPFVLSHNWLDICQNNWCQWLFMTCSFGTQSMILKSASFLASNLVIEKESCWLDNPHGKEQLQRSDSLDALIELRQFILVHLSQEITAHKQSLQEKDVIGLGVLEVFVRVLDTSPDDLTITARLNHAMKISENYLHLAPRRYLTALVAKLGIGPCEPLKGVRFTVDTRQLARDFGCKEWWI